MEWLFCRMYQYDNIGKDNSQLGNLLGSERIIKNDNISHTKTVHPNKEKINFNNPVLKIHCLKCVYAIYMFNAV